MATRKKKTEATNEVKIVKGSHLTVTTHPDGRTELEWDDEALLRDVRAAILKAESSMPVTEKKTKVKAATAKKKPAAKPKAETVKTVKKKPAAITAAKTTKKKAK